MSENYDQGRTLWDNFVPCPSRMQAFLKARPLTEKIARQKLTFDH